MEQNSSEHRRGGAGHVLRALRSRNYKLYFTGQGISLIGTWMQTVALSWLVYRLTGSALLLGTVGFASQIPSFILSPIGGILADRWNRRRLLIVTQSLAMVQAFVLATLVLTGNIKVWQIIALSIFSGIVFAFDMPTRQAFIVNIAEDRDLLGNAIALNSSLFNAARLLGPSIAGVLVAAVGEGICFLINGFSFLAVIACLVMMRVAPGQAGGVPVPVWRGLRDGFRYVAECEPISYILVLLAVISLLGMPYTVLMPIFAGTILHGGPAALGLLMASSGVGALIGAIYLASRHTVLGLGRLIPIAAVVFGLGLIAFSLSRTLWLSSLILAVAGLGMILQMASSNTIIQTIAEESKRGRVMSFYTMAFMGTAPFGSLLAGVLANRIGPPETVMLGGILCIVSALLFALKLPRLREIARPVYIRLQILPAISSGGQQSQVDITGEPED